MSIIKKCKTSRFAEAFREYNSEYVRKHNVSLTAIQYPKFINTLDKLTNQRLLDSCYDKLLRKLHTLHRNRIFHLDIKLPNLGYFMNGDSIDPRFADWGLSCIFDSTNRQAVENDFFQTLLPQFRFYYTSTLMQYEDLVNIYERYFPDLFLMSNREVIYSKQFIRDQFLNDSEREEFIDIEERLDLTFRYNEASLLAYFSELDEFALSNCFRK